MTAVGHQLTDMERALWDKTFAASPMTLEDTIFRAWGVMTNARIMPLKEFYKHWSGLRLGAEWGLLDVSTEVIDALLVEAQDAHLQAYAEKDLTGRALDEARAARIRQMLAPSL